MPDRLSPSREQEIRALAPRLWLHGDQPAVELLAELDALRADLTALTEERDWLQALRSDDADTYAAMKAKRDQAETTLAAIRAMLSSTLTNDTAKVREIWAVLLGCHWSDVKARLASAPAEKPVE